MAKSNFDAYVAGQGGGTGDYYVNPNNGTVRVDVGTTPTPQNEYVGTRPYVNSPSANIAAGEALWDRGEKYSGVDSNRLMGYESGADRFGANTNQGGFADYYANPTTGDIVTPKPPAPGYSSIEGRPTVPTTPAVPTVTTTPTEPVTPTTPTTPATPTTPDPAPTVPTTPSVPPTSEVVPGGTVVGGGVDGAIYSNGAVDIVPSGGGGYGAGGAADSRYEAPQLVSATDKSDYIRAMYEAQRDARLAALETAYNQSLAALEKQAATIPQYYYEAGRQTAGLNAREVQAMNERFAAAGLNTGASGQGALAQNAVFQGNMAGIRQAEANALAEVEADRAALAMQYQNEIKEAILNNESEKAAALYAEMIRVDESIVDTAYRQAGIDMTAQEFQFGVDKYNQGRADAAAEEQRSALEKKAQVLAAYGDFSGFRELGYPESVINAMQAEWNAENGIVSGGGTYTGGGGYSAPDGWTTQDVIDFQRANGLTPDGIWGPQTQGAYEKNGFNSIGGGAASVGAAVTQLQASGESDEVIAAYIAAAVEQGLITPQDAIWLRNG